MLRRYTEPGASPGVPAGKAPVDMVRKRFAKEIDDDVRERLISRLWREATSEKGLIPLGDPVLDDLKHEHGMPFQFKTTFEVLPKFEVKDYRGVEAKTPPVRASKTPRSTRRSSRSGSRTPATSPTRRGWRRPATSSSPTSTSSPREERDEAGEAAARGRGAGNPEPFNAEDRSARRTGAALAFEVDYPADHAERRSGREEGQLPARRSRGEAERDAAARRRAGQGLGRIRQSRGAQGARALRPRRRERPRMAHSGVRQAILDKVLVANPVPLPDVLVEEEIQHRLEDMVREMMFHGVDPRKAELDWKQLRDRNEEPARKIVHARLVLDAIAAAEGVTVNRKDLDVRIRREAERIGEGYDELRLRLSKSGGLQALETQMVREKSLDLITSIANIQGAE